MGPAAAVVTTPADTGPYALSKSTAGSSYTLDRRTGYTWGPAGTTTAEPGLPKTVVVRVAPKETTTANLLATGQITAGVVTGPDGHRLEKAGLTSHPTESMFGELIFNQNERAPHQQRRRTNRPTQALDLSELRTIATAGTGTAPTRLTGTSPCTADPVTDSLPTQDTDPAKAALSDVSGGPLTFVYLSKLGPATTAAAERAAQMWQAAGVDVKAKGLTDARLLEVGYTTGAWDIAWVPIAGQNPVQVAPTFSGASPTEGGNNFAGIDNVTYDDDARAASIMPDTRRCDLWARADSARVANADVVPSAMCNCPTWSVRTTAFDVDYYGVIPMSVRIAL